jgi:AsmA protein
MKKLLKVLGGLIGVAVLLIVAAIIAAPFLFDPNDQKPRIEALVKSKTGRDFSIQGDVSLSLRPSPRSKPWRCASSSCRSSRSRWKWTPSR